MNRWLELLLLFVLLPCAVKLSMADKQNWLMPLLVTTGLLCLAILLADKQFKRIRLWRTDNWRQHLLAGVKLFLPWACLLTLTLYWFFPERLFDLPRQHTELWLMTLILYPLISVLPQELIFRTYFFHRYKPILPSKQARWLLSSLVFALAHVVYGNWLAVAATAFAGLIFGYRYVQSRSMLIVAVEHTLWGSFVFTIGLGAFFLSNPQLS